jgi:hypothetical protein
LNVAIQAGSDGRAPDLELEDIAADDSILELEPGDGDPLTGTAAIVAGKSYKIRLRSPDLAAINFVVNLAVS